MLPFLPPGPARMRILAALAGLMGSIVGWYLAESASHVLRWEVQLPAESEPGLTLVVGVPSDPIVRAQDRADSRNAALALSVLGAVLGLCLGVAGGWSRGSRASAAAAGGLGLLLGLAVGAALPLLLCPLFFLWRTRPPDPILPLLIHLALYGGVSAVCGVAFGQGYSGASGALRGLLGAVMGSLVGVMLYSLIHTLWLPLESDYSPLPISPRSRLLACLSVVLVVVACLAAVLSGPRAVELMPPERAHRKSQR